MTQTWKNKRGEEVIKLEVDEVQGITLVLCEDENNKHASEVAEMQTLNMYPPKDEEKIGGESVDDGKWTVYRMTPGKNWDYAQKDIVATCDFWINGLDGF